MSSPVQIDGSFGEGGGQIIRTSLSLSMMTGRAVEIANVRARRTKSGLQPQHLTAVRAAAVLCDARLSGDHVGSSFLSFEPQKAIEPGDYHFDIGTAGAAPLVVQTVLIPLTQATRSSQADDTSDTLDALPVDRATPPNDPDQSIAISKVRVTGGTHVPHSPSVEYLEAVYFPALRRAGLDVALTYSSAGFYPRGGGEIEVEIHASAAPAALDFRERGKLRNLRSYIITSNLPEHVAQRGAETVERAMRAVGRKVTIEDRQKPSPGPGAAVVVAAECEAGLAAFTSIGELGKPMEKVAEAPCKEFMRWWKSGAACDEHLADQLVLPLAFSAGTSRWTTPVVTEHLRTVLWVTQQFLPIEVKLEEHANGSGTIELQGVGAL